MICRTVKIAIVLLVSLLVVFVAANSWDEELKPEVKALLSQNSEPTKQGLRAFYYSLGLRAGEDNDPEAEGLEIWQKGQALPVGQREKLYDTALKRVDDLWPSLPFPARAKGISVADYLSQVRKEHPAFVGDKNLSDHYLKLISYREYSMPDSGVIFSRADTPIQLLLKGHRYLTFRLGELANQKQYGKMERIVRDENQFYQSFFGHTHLLGTMIAHVILEENADLLVAEKKKNPALKFKPETLASFKTPSDKEMLTSAMNHEFLFLARMIEDMTDGSLLTMFLNPQSESLMNSGAVKTRLLIKPNATLNRYYSDIQKELLNPCLQDCPSEKSWWTNENPITLIRNPGGKWVANLMMTNIGGRFKKLAERSKSLGGMVERSAK